MAEDGYSLKGLCAIKDKGCKSKELAPRLGKTGLDILPSVWRLRREGRFQLRLYLLAFPEPGKARLGPRLSSPSLPPRRR